LSNTWQRTYKSSISNCQQPWRLKAREQQLDISADFRRTIAGQQGHQPLAPQIPADQESRLPDNAKARQRRRAGGIAIVGTSWPHADPEANAKTGRDAVRRSEFNF
jgi:hypothetical protein